MEWQVFTSCLFKIWFTQLCLKSPKVTVCLLPQSKRTCSRVLFSFWFPGFGFWFADFGFWFAGFWFLIRGSLVSDSRDFSFWFAVFSFWFSVSDSRSFVSDSRILVSDSRDFWFLIRGILVSDSRILVSDSRLLVSDSLFLIRGKFLIRGLFEAKRVVSELRPPATIVLHIHRCIGREQQLHHRCFAIGCCPVQWGVTSAQRQHTAREGFEQSHSQSHCAQSHRMCIRASTPTKLGTKLLESMFVTRPFSFAASLIGLWPKSTPPSIVSSLSQPCRYNKSNLLNPLNSLTQSAQTYSDYSALMHHIDTACRESRFKTIQNLSNVFKFYLLSGRLSGIHGKTLCEEHGERK